MSAVLLASVLQIRVRCKYRTKTTCYILLYKLTTGKFGSVAINVGTAVILTGDEVGNCAAVRSMLDVSRHRQATRFPSISLILLRNPQLEKK